MQSRLEQKQSSRKKLALHKELEDFLISLPVPSTICTCSPGDLLRFLAYKDLSGFGKTVVHSIDCEFLGKIGKQSCLCPLRLSLGYLQNLVSNLKSLLYREGRGNSWDNLGMTGNPACSPAIADYIEAVKDEQAQAHIVRKQAIPMSLAKMIRLAEYLYRESKCTDLSIKERFIVLRDRAFFLLLFCTGSRGGDLTKLLFQEIHSLDDASGLVIRETYGKMRAERFVTVKVCETVETCPVLALREYVEGANMLSVKFEEGYVFRSTSNKGYVLDNHVSQPTMNKRLALYLDTLGINDCETTHSLRAGCAVLLKHHNNSDLDSAQHIGWKTQSTWEHYCRARTINARNAAVIIADCFSKRSPHGESQSLIESSFDKLPKF